MSGHGEPQRGDLHVRQGVVDRGATGLAVQAVQAESFTLVTNIVAAHPGLAVNTVEYARRLLVTHEARLGALRGFSEFLHEAKLPFVEPPRGDSAHPQRVWREIQRARLGGGVLLSGAGGVGKTRCAVEVAKLAEQSGWKVVWLRDAEHTPALLVLESALDAAVGGLCDNDTLLVLDYVDQMVGLNLEHLSRHFSSFDNRVRLLATSRPLRSEQLSRGLPLLCIVVDPQPEHRRALISTMIRQAAPNALARLGDAVLAQICGDRPIIALLIARVLEEREESGALTEEFLVHARTRGRELFLWLDRRLSAFIQDLGPSFGDAGEKRSQLDRLAAAILALGPLAQTDLQAGARRVAERLGMQPHDADDLIGLLHETGWLEGDPERELWVVHDVVADQALEVALAAERASERQRALGDVLSSVSAGARALGRVTTSLSRAALSGEERFRQRIEADSRTWWNANIEGLAAVIAEDHHDVAGYALGSLLKRTPWQGFILERWNDLLGPWLARNGRAAGARHVLYLGLRHVRSDVSRMLAAARAWLEANGLDLNASFVLASVLEHPETPDEAFHEASARALAWLEVHGGQEEAKYVLRALLGQPRMAEGTAREASERALAWLKEHGTQDDATFVLSALLETSRLDEDAAQEAIERALAWLKDHGRQEEARYVLRALLGQPQLGEGTAREASERALTWLAAYETREDATFVLSALLETSYLDEDTAREASERALAWLKEHGTLKNAGFVLRTLLARQWLAEETVREATDLTLAWLTEYGMELDATYVLSALLGQPKLEEEAARTANERALEWLDEHAGQEEARYVLRALLGQSRPGEELAPAVSERALAWLKEHVVQDDASFVLRALLRQPRLDDATAREASERALAWLDAYGQREDASFVLRALLRQPRLDDATAREASERALAWLDAYGQREDASFVLPALLGQPKLGEAAREASKRALQWLQRYGTQEYAQFVLRALLGVDRAPASLDHACSWVAAYARSDVVHFVAIPLLKCQELDDERWRACADVVCDRLNHEPLPLNGPGVLSALKHREHLVSGSHGLGLSTVLSCREIVEAERERTRRSALEGLQAGEIVEGVVTSVKDYGVFLDLGGIDGLVRTAELSWARSVTPSDLLRVGDRTRVKILRIDRESARVELSLRLLTPDPWERAGDRYLPGMVVEGKVVKIESYGAFVELEMGVEGLVHVSEMSWIRRTRHPGERLKIGEVTRVLVLDRSTAQKRIALSMKRIAENPHERIVKKYPPGTRIDGIVRNVVDYGVFVEIEPGIDGLAHGRRLYEAFRKGEKVRAIVVEIDDPGTRPKIRLGVLQRSKESQ